MTLYITRALAQQIVDTVRDLCGQNVNFIDCSGTIFASTDESRIGTFHEIGREAAASGSVIEVRENDHFTGTQQGGAIFPSITITRSSLSSGSPEIPMMCENMPGWLNVSPGF